MTTYYILHDFTLQAVKMLSICQQFPIKNYKTQSGIHTTAFVNLLKGVHMHMFIFVCTRFYED